MLILFGISTAAALRDGSRPSAFLQDSSYITYLSYLNAVDAQWRPRWGVDSSRRNPEISHPRLLCLPQRPDD
jgi:hypothetical protein